MGRIDGTRVGLDPTQALQQQQLQLQQTRVALRILDGNPSGLQLGERVSATVIQTTSAGTLLNLKGARLLVDSLPEAITPGTDLLLRVAGLVPQAVLELDTGNQSTDALKAGPRLLGEFGSTRAASQLPALEIGQELTAAIRESLPGGRFLVDVQGTLVDAALRGTVPEAVARGDLKEGSVLPLRVEQLLPQVVFRILPHAVNEQQALQLLRAQVVDSVPVGQSLQFLNQALQAQGQEATLSPSLAKVQAFLQSILPVKAPLTAEQITTLVRDGGLLFEAKLAQAARDNPQAMSQVADKDLKGLLLQTLRNEPALAQGLSHPVANHLSHIETQQAINLLAQFHAEPYLLQIPFYNGPALSTAYVSIEADRHGRQAKGSQQQGYDVLFQLDLEQLGQTRIDAHLTRQTVRAVFYSDRGEALARMRAELPSFRQSLLALGYEEVLLAAKPLGQLAPDKQQKFRALAAGFPTAVSRVDVRV